MNRRSKPRCVCAPDCSNITWKGPVCGSDGKTYKDECALLKAKCKGHPDLDVQYQGKCKSKKYYWQLLWHPKLHNCCMCQESSCLCPCFSYLVSIFQQNLPISLSFQKRAATSCAPAAPHASWTRQITHIVWRVIGFAQRWRRLSSTCVETTGSSMPVRVTWEELPVSSADLLEWHMRGNASVSLQQETWDECET